MASCTFTSYHDPIGSDKPITFICTAIFYMPGYLRKARKKDTQDLSLLRQQQIFNGVSYTVEKFRTKQYPDHWRYRIYWDSSLIGNPKLPPWKQSLLQWAKIPNVELIQYDCPEDYSPKNKHYHNELFGTLMRFRTFFDDKANWSCAFMVDGDNIITPEMYKVMREFEDGPATVHVFSSAFEFTGQHIWKNEKSPTFFRAGLVGSKIQFPSHLWKELFTDIQKNPKLEALMADMERKVKSFMGDAFQSFRPYAYGFDEIFLNSYIKTLWIEKGAVFQVTQYRPNVQIAGYQLFHFLEWVHNHPNPTPAMTTAFEHFFTKLPSKYNSWSKFKKNYYYLMKTIGTHDIYGKLPDYRRVHGIFYAIHKQLDDLKQMGFDKLLNGYIIEFWEKYPVNPKQYDNLPSATLYLHRIEPDAPFLA